MTSHDLIAKLRERHALDPRPLPTDLSAYHVPFDILNGDGRTEAALARAAVAMERVALIGDGGVGKSSVISHVFRLGSGFAPVVVPVFDERAEVVSDPGAFAAHTVQVLARYAEQVELTAPMERDRYLRAIAERTHLPSTERGLRAGIKLAPWIAQFDVGADLKRVTPPAEIQPSASQYVAALDDMIAVVKRTELTPVLIIDDSDRWLRLDDGEPRNDVVEPFLARVLRMLADRAIGFVVAVHRTYVGLAGYTSAVEQGTLETFIDVPALGSRRALEALLEHRVRLHAAEAALADVFTDAALAELWAVYGGGAASQIRKTLQVAHGALADADASTLEGPIDRPLVQASAVAALR